MRILGFLVALIFIYMVGIVLVIGDCIFKALRSSPVWEEEEDPRDD